MASLTIPATYLDDARSALLALLAEDNQALQEAEEERKPRAVTLQRNARLLAAVSDATGDLELTAESDRISNPLPDVLEQIVRQAAERLTHAVQYAPMTMRDVLDLAERLQWAAREAVRLEPSMDKRLSAHEWERAAA